MYLTKLISLSTTIKKNHFVFKKPLFLSNCIMCLLELSPFLSMENCVYFYLNKGHFKDIFVPIPASSKGCRWLQCGSRVHVSARLKVLGIHSANAGSSQVYNYKRVCGWVVGA